MSPRRLLLIARHVAPLNVSGAVRVESFARHLPAAGWVTTVVSARHGGSDDNGDAESDLPVGCTVVRALAFDTKDVFSIFGRYPGVLAFPDRDASWIVGGVRQALRWCRRERCDAILSTSPVVSAHCIGFVTSRISRLPWVIDLRDPWNAEAPFGPLLSSLDDRLERFLLRCADAVTVTTPGMAEAIEREHGSDVGRKTHVVRNGYEEEAVRRAFGGVAAPSRFRIAHAGDTNSRDPTGFLRALRLCLERGTLPADVCVEWIGSAQDRALGEAVRALELGAHVRSTPRVAHAAALGRLADAAVLLLIQSNPQHRLSIPVKSYEYLTSGRMILAITEEHSETSRLLRGFAGVWIAPPGDVERIAASLEAVHDSWKSAPGRVFERDVSAYTRRRQAAELGRVLNTVVGQTLEGRR